MAEKDGFTYIYSPELGQKIAISEKTGKVYCQDKTVYSLDEVKILQKAGGITKGIHLVKKIFVGSVISTGPIKKEAPWKDKEASENISKQEQHSSAESTPQQTQRSDERFLDWQESVIF